MAIQDTFIGNLRAAKDIARGTASIIGPKKTTAVEAPKNIPKNVDKPSVDWSNWRNNHDAAISSARIDTTWKNPEENIISKYPMNFEHVQMVKPYKPLFDQAITEYSNEPDAEKRIKILDNYGKNTALGELPGTSWYLNILRNTEDSIKRSGGVKYDYAGTARDIQKALEAEINKFNPTA